MTYRLEFKPEASADVVEAFSWYEQRRLRLGREFEAELDRTLGYVTDMPLAGHIVHQTLRRALLRRFPFTVYYAVTGDLIEVRAVLHNRRHPRTWLRRA